MMEANKSKINKNRIGAGILCALIFAFSVFVVGCGRTNISTTHSLNMDYYTATRSTYNLIYPNDEYTTDSTDFVGSNIIKRAYNKITVKLSSEWLYLFRADKFEFNLTTNHDCADIAENNTSLQFNVMVTNLHSGSTDGAIAVKHLSSTVICEQTAGESKTYVVNIDDYFEKSAEITCIIFTLETPEIYAIYPDFEFAISNIKLFGKHQYI